ncbi:DUF5999 family protein [Streptomyces noursei]|uniref:DUF5999 family protein n=1 Tax=Streptomyces noursei TaxID=1971 RepID=UPI0012FF5A60
MCAHTPPCPTADAADRQAAQSKVHHPEQGRRANCTNPLRGTLIHRRRDGA